MVVQLKLARKKLYQHQINNTLSTQLKLISKPVLIPFNVNINVNAQSWLDKNINQIEKLGFEFSMLGEDQIMVRQVPAMLSVIDVKESMNQFILSLLNNEFDFPGALIEMMVKDQFSNSPTEWNSFLRELENAELENDCHHQISENDLAGWFKQ